MDDHHFFYIFLWMIITFFTSSYGWSPLVLHLFMDDHHFFYIFLWMITTLATNKNSFEKKTLIIRDKNGDVTRLGENEWGVPLQHRHVKWIDWFIKSSFALHYGLHYGFASLMEHETTLGYFPAKMCLSRKEFFLVYQLPCNNNNSSSSPSCDDSPITTTYY